MSLFFDRFHNADTSFTIKRDAEKAGLDIALVGKKLWNDLTSSAPGTNRIALSITRRTQKDPFRPHSTPHALTCWAAYDEETTELSIPRHWSQVYQHVFSETDLPRKSLLVATVRPALLTEVIVAALSHEAYQAASAHDSILEYWFSDEQPILRQGDIYKFDTKYLSIDGASSASSGYHQYRLDMIEPVMQGYAQKGTTRLLITLADMHSPELREDSQLGTEHEEEFASDYEGIEIDESFLASSVLSPVQDSSSHFSCPLYPMNGSVTMNSGSDEHPATFSDVIFRVEVLSQIISPAEGDCTLYVRTADLSRIGVLNNDWAVVHLPGTSNYRLVRVTANDHLVHSSGVVMSSPMFLRNISAEFTPAPTMRLSLHASPFGSGLPAVPVARTVTVARVASPFTTDRVYQPLFLHALKDYFDGKRRLVKQGDMIAAGIDSNLLHNLQEVAEDPLNPDDIDVADYTPTSSVRTNEVVFFVITNVEHDFLSTGRDSILEDYMYMGATAGELGCWVNPAVTRMVQTGVEHFRVPDVAGYMGMEAGNSSALLASLDRLSFRCLVGPDGPFGRLLSLSAAALVPEAVNYNLHLTVLLKGARGIGKVTVAQWVARRLGMHLFEVNCYDIVGENKAKTEGILRARFEKASSCTPCVLVLRHVDALAETTQALEIGKGPSLVNALQECIGDIRKTWKMTGYPVFVFGTTSDHARVPTGVLSCFKHEVAFEPPDESERFEILSSLLLHTSLAPDVSLSALATQTAALVASDLVDLVSRAVSMSRERVSCVMHSDFQEANWVRAGIPLAAVDFDVALVNARASYSESIGAPNIPNVSWDDVGGLAGVKSDILDTVQLPLEHPELFADGLKKRSGILLYGPPGTGKTLLAKAVATSCSLNFFSVKGPELLNMYIGESEANVRRVFQRARDAKPCVIFFDELDSVAPKRGNHGDSGGVMDRIVSQLLAELDGMSAGTGGADVFVIGATNRPDLLDPALLRPGRFDRMLYLGLSETHMAQFHIIEALTRKFRLHPSLDLRRVAEQCPFNYTGADFYALCSDAMLNAMSRKAEEVEAKIAYINNSTGPKTHPQPLTPQYYLSEMASDEDTDVLVSRRDFDSALGDLVPSVSQSEMDHYANIQRRFSREISVV